MFSNSSKWCFIPIIRRNLIVIVCAVLFLLAASANVFAGCSSDSEDSAPDSAFLATDETIEFDPHWCIERSATIGFGLGSLSIEVQGIEDDRCVFTYMHEIEGGYSLYLCRVEQSETRVTIKVTGVAGDQNSFNLENCELLRSGNLLLEMRGKDKGSE